MLRQYAPVPGTARRSPGCTSAGRNSSFTTMSPDSQCFPTTRASIGSARDARPATVALYDASYSAVRMLSLIPPSTLTYVRMPSTSLTVPTSYSVNTAGPTIARPGSIDKRRFCLPPPAPPPDQSPRPLAGKTGKMGQPFDLVERVDHDPPDARLEGPGQLGR